VLVGCETLRRGPGQTSICGRGLAAYGCQFTALPGQVGPDRGGSTWRLPRSLAMQVFRPRVSNQAIGEIPVSLSVPAR
jgi:hypothetical protein